MKKNININSFLFNTDYSKKSKFPCDFHIKYENIERWNLLSIKFEEWNINVSKKLSKQEIPKKIHQIWLGSPVPEKYKTWMNSWKNLNKGWDYYLWDDEKIKSLNMQNRDLFDTIENLGAKSDIARLEILRLFGGIYVDTDFQCLRPLNDQILKTKMFACCLSNYSPQIGNGIIGASKDSKILLNCIFTLTKNKLRNPTPNEISNFSGPCFFTRHIFDFLDCNKSNFDEVIIFPSNYFYPVPSFIKKLDYGNLADFLSDETFAIHHYESSWSKYKITDRIKIKIKEIYKKFLEK